MRAKTVIIILVTMLVTVILMKNTDEVTFWIFGDKSVPKLAVLGVMFIVGFTLGYLAGRPRKKTEELPEEDFIAQEPSYPLDETPKKWLDPEDDDYIN